MFYPPLVGYLVISIVSAGLAFASSRGSLTRNHSIGIRTKHTLRSDSAWDAAQQAGVAYLVAIAIVAGAHAMALLTVELTHTIEILGHLLALSGYLIIVVISLIAWRSADLAAKNVTASE